MEHVGWGNQAPNIPQWSASASCKLCNVPASCALKDFISHLQFHLVQSKLPWPRITELGRALYFSAFVPWTTWSICDIKVKFILDTESDRAIAQISIFIRVWKEQVFVCLDFFELLSWKRGKGQPSMTALLFHWLCRPASCLKSSLSNRGKIRKTFCMEGEEFEEQFLSLGIT